MVSTSGTPSEHHYSVVRLPGANDLPPDRTDELRPVLRWGHHTGTPKANPNRRPKRGPKGKPKGQWGDWHNAGQAAHLAGGTFQAQTPPTFLGQDREAEYETILQNIYRT
jgi:hypothetical protein